MFLFKLLRRAIAFVLLLVIMIPVFALGKTWYAANNPTIRNGDVIVVLGAAQLDGRPGLVLEARLTEAKRIYDLGLAKKIITVGGGAPGDRSRVLKLLTHARREVVFQLSLLAQSCNTLRLRVQRTQDKPSLYRKQRARSMPRGQSPGLVYPALARPPARRAALSAPAAAVPPISRSTALPALATC